MFGRYLVLAGVLATCELHLTAETLCMHSRSKSAKCSLVRGLHVQAIPVVHQGGLVGLRVPREVLPLLRASADMGQQHAALDNEHATSPCYTMKRLGLTCTGIL